MIAACDSQQHVRYEVPLQVEIFGARSYLKVRLFRPQPHLPHSLNRLILILVSPSRLRQPLVYNIAHSPRHSFLIRHLIYIIVGTNGVELALAHLLVQEIRNLFGSPCAIRLRLRLPAACQAGEGPARHEQVHGGGG